MGTVEARCGEGWEGGGRKRRVEGHMEQEKEGRGKERRTGTGWRGPSLLPSLEKGVSGHTRRYTQLPLGEQELMHSLGLDMSMQMGKRVPACACVFVLGHPAPCERGAFSAFCIMSQDTRRHTHRTLI